MTGLKYVPNIEHALAVALVEMFEVRLEQAKEMVKRTRYYTDILCDDLTSKRIKFWVRHIGRVEKLKRR